MKYATILFLVLFGCELNSKQRDWHDWKDTEKAEYIGYTIINYADFKQTELCISQKVVSPCEEKNPLFGSQPNDATIAAGFLLGQVGYYMMIKYSDDYPILKHARWAVLGSKIAIVWTNDESGIRINKVW
jgi:hypothetical protein